MRFSTTKLPPTTNLTGDGTWSYGYDLDNRLKSASKTGTAATLAYDAEGRLRQTAIGSNTTNLLYDAANLIAEYDAAGTTIQRRYVHGPGTDEPIVWYEGAGTTAKNWLYADHLGSIVATANSTGASTGIYSYGPFGEPNTATGPRFRYTGQQLIGELGLYHYKARFYSPTLGRFLQTDPIGYKDDVNLYAYVGSNPINRIDPTGLASLGAWAKLGSGESLARELWEDCQGMCRSGVVTPDGKLDIGLDRVDAGGCIATGGGPSICVGPGAINSVTSLFRAVTPVELADIGATGAFRNLGSAEGKYFTTSASAAAAYAKQAVRGFGDEAHTIVETIAPKSILHGLTPAMVDGGIPAWVIPNSRLPGLIPKVMDHSPLP